MVFVCKIRKKFCWGNIEVSGDWKTKSILSKTTQINSFTHSSSLRWNFPFFLKMQGYRDDKACHNIWVCYHGLMIFLWNKSSWKKCNANCLWCLFHVLSLTPLHAFHPLILPVFPWRCVWSTIDESFSVPFWYVQHTSKESYFLSRLSLHSISFR